MYTIRIKPSASKESEKIPEKDKDRIRKAINELKKEPRDRNVAVLKGRVGIHRIRVGNYRVLFAIDDKKRVISILSILHRKEAYR